MQSSEDFHCQAGQWPDDTRAGKWSIGTNGRKYIEKQDILTFIGTNGKNINGKAKDFNFNWDEWEKIY